LSGLDDASREPRPDEVRSLLGGSFELWARLIAEVSANHPPVTEQWNFGGAKIGWTLRLKRQDRIILYLIPQAGGFLVGVVLGERAWERAQSVRLPESVRRLAEEAPRRAEGRGFRVPVTSDEDVEALVGLVAAKMAS
jgi:hypothetical protein